MAIIYRQLTEDEVLQRIKDKSLGDCFYEAWSGPILEAKPYKLIKISDINLMVNDIDFTKVFERVEESNGM